MLRRFYRASCLESRVQFPKSTLDVEMHREFPCALAKCLPWHRLGTSEGHGWTPLSRALVA